MPTKKRLSTRPETLVRRFRDRNRRFKKLNITRQRLKIIQDVITYLESGKLKATDREYLQLKNRKKINQEDQLHNIIEQATTCKVCGIGSMFVSAIMLKNDFKIRELVNTNSLPDLSLGQVDHLNLREYLSRWFSDDQLELIEAAFQRSTDFSARIDSEIDYAVLFGDKYQSAKTRLLSICKNMLKNDGVFVA